MSAERLREAALVLRERSEGASHAPWRTYEHQGRDPLDEGWSEIGVQNYGHTVAVTYPTGFENEYPEPDATYIATMHPGVGLALADWLDATTCGLHCGADGMRFPYCSACEDSTYDHECPKRELCKHTGPMRRALAIADLILGDAP